MLSEDALKFYHALHLPLRGLYGTQRVEPERRKK